MQIRNYELRIKDWKTIAVVAAIVLFGLLTFVLGSPLSAPEEVVIEEGQSVYEIAEVLKRENMIRGKFVFVVYVLLTGNEKNLKAGRYTFKPGDDVPIIVHSVANGLAESEDITVTVPEGYNIWEIDQKFTQAGLIKKGDISKNFRYKEGRLFPDTYRFKKETSLDKIINKMEENYFIKGGTRSEEVIIVASLLEKEAKTKEDMELIAGIIYKRLKLKMLLQIDASVGYGWCVKESSKPGFNGFCDVTQTPISSEIKIDGPYNTYARLGFPQGVISNPGLIALTAAQNPKSSDYLFYLSTRDGSRMIYSKTASEHLENRKKYLGF